MIEFEVFQLKIDHGELLPGIVMKVLRNSIQQLFLSFEDCGVECFLEGELFKIVFFDFLNVEFDYNGAE